MSDTPETTRPPTRRERQEAELASALADLEAAEKHVQTTRSALTFAREARDARRREVTDCYHAIGMNADGTPRKPRERKQATDQHALLAGDQQ